jgi:hypothetical protein
MRDRKSPSTHGQIRLTASLSKEQQASRRKTSREVTKPRIERLKSLIWKVNDSVV